MANTEMAQQRFELPAKQQDFRCPTCSTVWGISLSRNRALKMNVRGFAGQRKDADGDFRCCENKFRWAE